MDTKTSAELISLAEVKSRPIEWLWEGRVAIGKLSIISGDPGLGKSLITISMAAIVSRGGEWPVDATVSPLGSVLLMSAEDDLADTIRPRLDAAHADVTKIDALPMVKCVDQTGKQGRRFFSLASDLPVLEAVLENRPAYKLVVIDPISAYTGQTDTHNNSDVRGLLAPLADLVQKCRVAIVCVTHLNKGSGAAIYRSMGSLAFVAAARSAFVVVKSPHDPQVRWLLPTKNNLGNDSSGLAYSIKSHGQREPRLAWEPDAVYLEADDALEMLQGKSRLARTREWLEKKLENGPISSNELKDQASIDGLSWVTVRRAKDELQVKSEKHGFNGGWSWQLPKMLINGEDAHSLELSTFDHNEHLGADLSTSLNCRSKG